MPLDEVPHLELTHLRVAVAPTFPGLPVAADIRSAIEGLAQQLKPLCVAMEEATLPAAFPHCEPGSPLRVDDQEVIYWVVSGHGTLFNYTGHPAVVLPYKLDRDGLPIGVQLVGKRWEESRLLAVARVK